MPRAFVVPPQDRLAGEFYAASGAGVTYRSRALAPGDHTLADDEAIFGSLRGGRLDRAAIDALAALPSLDALTLADLTIDDDAAAALASLASIERLDLTRVPLTSGLLAALRRLPGLTRASIRGAAFDDDAARALAGAAGLRSLSLLGEGTPLPLTDAGVAALGALELTHLQIEVAPAITGAGLRPHADAARLTSLQLCVCAELGEAAVIDHVARLARLIYLDLSFDVRLGDRAIAALAALSALDGLMLRGLTRLGGAGLLALAALPALQSLHLSTTKRMKKCTAADVDALRLARPGLTVSRT